MISWRVYLANTPEEYEYLIEETYRHIVRCGDMVVDVGANCGRHMIPLAELVGPGGSVYAFEPLPEQYHALRKWVCNRPQESATVHVFPVAVSDHEGDCEFYVNVLNSACFSGLQPQNGLAGTQYRTISTRTCTLDSAMPELESPRFIKIDVDGGELGVLKGARGILTRHKPPVVFEFGDSGLTPYGVRSSEVFDLLSELGYMICSITGTLVETREEFVRSSKEQAVWNYVAVHKTDDGLLLDLSARLKRIHQFLHRDVLRDADDIRVEIATGAEHTIRFDSIYDHKRIPLSLRNTGCAPIMPAFVDRSERGALKLGIRWLQDGHYTTEERRALPCVLLPSEEVEMAIDLYPSASGYYLAPGRYIASLQLVSEFVTWLPEFLEFSVVVDRR